MNRASNPDVSSKTWSNEYRYCPQCGTPMERTYCHGRMRPACPSCGYIQYLNPTPAVATVLLKDGQVLLVRRRYKPRRGYWSLPAGFVEWEEGIREAALREVKEETNCDVEISGLLAAFSAFDDDRTHVVLIVFAGILRGGTLRAGDDAEEVRFFPLDQLPENMAFAAHCNVLEQIREGRFNERFKE